MLKRIHSWIIRKFKSNRKRSKGINGSIESVNGDKISLRRLERHIDISISRDRAIYENYDDWLYLQTKKGHPGTFQELWNVTKAKQQKVWNFVGIEKKDKVLDIGFRDGFNLKELEKKCSSVVGIDVNKDAIHHAKELGCQVFQEDIQKETHFKNNSFDIIILSDVLEHCFSPESALKECNRITKPEGRIVIDVPFENEFNRNLLHGHATLFKNEMFFEQLLRDCGFSIVKKDLSNKARNLYVARPLLKTIPEE